MKVSVDKIIKCIQRERDLDEADKIFIRWIAAKKPMSSKQLIENSMIAGFDWTSLRIYDLATYTYAAILEITGANK